MTDDHSASHITVMCPALLVFQFIDSNIVIDLPPLQYKIQHSTSKLHRFNNNFKFVSTLIQLLISSQLLDCLLIQNNFNFKSKKVN